ncbi:hypothetical protein [Thalassotalea eurytherma]|uniref:DUF2570 domain-containing protein n=1 Tax=Thalassotalea eurytherma TaxID=1144278 RepID=A0ABQ6GXR8_9GAMM|nr:hypothetical protein [Thalassotalea eurytherma]GLX80733.1 hypothetical protein theurythT_01850 [Thalassotalea eurytherma]
MEFNLKKTLALILAILIAFTLFWFIRFGTFLWFANLLGNELTNSSKKLIIQQQKIAAEQERERKIREYQKAQAIQRDLERRTQISFGNNANKISEQDKKCNDAILAAMSNKSEKAKQLKKEACAHNMEH